MVKGTLIRQNIVDEIVEQLRKISSANGFYSEAGKNVYEWLEKPLDFDEFPAIIVRDVSDEVQDETVFYHKLKIEVDIAIKKDNVTWNLREISSDVLKAFGVVEENLGYRCFFKRSEFLVEHKDTLYGGARLEFEVSYETRRWEQ